MKQVNFSLFAAAQAAALCPPAGAVQTANDVPALVAQPGTSGQRVGSLSHGGRRAARRDACYSALQRRGVLSVDRFALVLHGSFGPSVITFCLRPHAFFGRCSDAGYQTLLRIRGAV